MAVLDEPLPDGFCLIPVPRFAGDSPDLPEKFSVALSPDDEQPLISLCVFDGVGEPGDDVVAQ